MSAQRKPTVIGRQRRFPLLVSSPAAFIILLLIPLMVLEGVGMAAEGRKRHGTFEGAIMLMAASLALVWNVIGGTMMYLGRNMVLELVRKSPLSGGATFLLFATGLALLEEGVTTTLTDLAPVFGNSQAFITASRNYLEVVVWHSVVVIVPMLVVWAWLLARYRFSPGSVFLLFRSQWCAGGTPYRRTGASHGAFLAFRVWPNDLLACLQLPYECSSAHSAVVSLSGSDWRLPAGLGRSRRWW